ncbi:TNT domain-containing protein [Streptomyces sp. NPDC093085]|uniref:TNT domain-containing protein n=1 Tax=Streptomyces sp. NPDC093085 TaxID=3155068 RepID=UPI00341BEDB2
MNRMRTALAGVGVAAALIMAPAAASAAPQQDMKGSVKAAVPLPVTDAVANTLPGALAPAPCTGAFLDDARLGPRYLPGASQKPVGPLLVGWERTGKLSPPDFLKKYWEGPADSGSWKYPPHDGFAVVNGKVDKKATVLKKDQKLDRFGGEGGRYLAPVGDPYAKRALPPQNLNTRDAAVPCDYRVYRVLKPFTVWQGGIAPWFEQPGGGQQIQLDAALLDPGPGEYLNVTWLLKHEYLDHASA